MTDTRKALGAVSVVFFLVGVGAANWAVRIPAIEERLHLGEGRLGLALLGVSAGALLAMPLAGRLVARRGSRPVTWAAVLAYAVTLALPARAPTFLALTLLLVALGMANGMLDVAMNAQAATVQRRYGRPVMGRIHALYSFGGLTGAAIGGRVASHGVDVRAHLAGAGLAIGVIGAIVVAGMLPARADAVPDHIPLRRPTRALLNLGIVSFCVLFGEGAMANWSAVYLHDVTRAGPGLAAAGFAAFSLMMALGRLAADALTVRLGSAQLVRAGGTLAATGMTLVLSVPQAWAAIVGFGAVGAGLSGVFPVALSTAGRVPGVAPSEGIAIVSVCGYAGLLAGPPLIGAVASVLTLRGGLVTVALTSIFVAVLAPAMRLAERDGEEHAHPLPRDASDVSPGTRPAVGSLIP